MIFDIDAGLIESIVTNALEKAASDISQEQFVKICDEIENCMPGIIAVLTQGMAEHWKAEAMGAGGWGGKYAQAIKFKVEGETGEVYLDDKVMDGGSNKPNIMFAMMMEKGVKSWSIKDALLKSEKAKIGPSGIKYIIVPFPVRAPQSNKNMKMAKQFGGREMTEEMHAIVKGGGRLPVGSILKVKGKNVDVSGLTRYNTRQFHSQYGFFRCVSEKSKGWQYPNVPPESVFQGVLDEVNKRTAEVITAFLEEIVKEHNKK